MTLRLQDAQWIPCAIEFDLAYEYKITALVDKVEIVQERSKSGNYFEPEEEVVVCTLSKRESLRGKIIEQKSFVPALIPQKSKLQSIKGLSVEFATFLPPLFSVLRSPLFVQ